MIKPGFPKLRRQFVSPTLSKIQKSGAIVLTASFIANTPTHDHKIKDEYNRIRQYIYCLLSWPNTNIQDIIFCENNIKFPFDFNDLISICNSKGTKLEILRFDSSKQDKYKGYGFLEHNILKYVFENSKFLLKHKNFFKVTGRLFIENFNEINTMNLTNNNVFSKCYFDNRFLDTRFFKMSCDFFRENLYNIPEDRFDFAKNHIESVYTQHIKDFDFFKEKPIIVGREAYHNIIYDKDYSQELITFSQKFIPERPINQKR